MPAHRKFPIDRETLGEMVGRALYDACEDLDVVEATLIALAVAAAPRVAFGVWEDLVHNCRCPVGITCPTAPVEMLEPREEYGEFTSSFDRAARRYVSNRFQVSPASGVLEVR